MNWCNSGSASAAVRQAAPGAISNSSVEKKLSATALSQQSPLRLRVVRLLRLDELEAHFPLLAKKAEAFRRKSRSIVTVFNSRRSRVFSARSSLVSGPCGSFLSSISALFTQARTLVFVSPSSRDTAPTLLPLVRISFTTSALYSFVNDLLALAMDSILLLLDELV